MVARHTPTTPSPAVVGRIVAALEQGTTIEAACSAGPIARATYYAWRKVAERERLAAPGADTPHTRFADAVDSAMDVAERVLVERIAAASVLSTRTRTVTKRDAAGAVTETTETTEDVPGDFRAAAWILERRWPSRWRAPDASAPRWAPSYLTDEERAEAMLDGLETFLSAKRAEANAEANGHA